MLKQDSLLRQATFLRLLVGQGLATFGSQVSLIAIPLVAASTLDASPGEMGTLAAVGGLPYLIASLPAGVIVDRLPTRSVLGWSNLIRALILAVIPLSAVTGVLSMPILYVTGLLVGLASVFFSLGQYSVLPSIVRPDQLVDANGKLETTRSIAATSGPAIGGVLVQVFGGPIAVLANIAMYVVSAVVLNTLPSHRKATPRSGAVGELVEALRFVWNDPGLRAIALSAGTWNLFSAMAAAILVLFATRELGMPPAELGIAFAAGNAGFFVGSLVAAPIAKALGFGRALALAILVGGAFVALPGLATPALALGFLLVSQLGRSLCVVLFNVNQISLRQALTSERMQGRVHAVAQFLIQGTYPLGSILGGGVASGIGLSATILLAGVLMSAAAIWIIASPLAAMTSPASAGTTGGGGGES